jgi:hypothetical protein
LITANIFCNFLIIFFFFVLQGVESQWGVGEVILHLDNVLLIGIFAQAVTGNKVVASLNV